MFHIDLSGAGRDLIIKAGFHLKITIMRLGRLYKEAEQFYQLQKEIPILIELSNKPKKEILNKAGINSRNYHRMLYNTEQFQVKHLLALLQATIEIDNYERLKNKIQ